MSRPNPYTDSIEDYLQEYEGQYDPLFQQKQTNASDNPKVSLQKKRTLDQEESIIRKTVEKVKDKTESVIEDFTSKQTLSDVSSKKSLSIVDYAILLSSIYGIGAAVGITAGAATNITPNMNKKPILFWSMMGLATFGAYKGFNTVTSYKKLKSQLQEQSELEKRLSRFLPENRMYLEK